MISHTRISVQFAAMAVALGVAFTAAAQSNIRLEESTGTVTRQDNRGVIDIKIGAKATAEPTAVKIEAPTGSGAIAPADNIEMNPTEFSMGGGRSTTGTLVTSPDELDAPSGVPVPADTTQDKPEAVDLPVDKPTTAAITPTPTPVPAPVNTPVIAPDEQVDYLPPANLGKEAFVTREGQQIPMRPEQLSSAPLTFTVPDVYGTTLTNGLHFYHYESHDLPRVRVNLLIEAGQNADPADKVGLAELTERTMRSGGANGKSGDEIDQQLEQIGSNLEFNVDRDHVSGSLFALTSKADEAMALLADIIMKPEFDQKKFEQQKDRSMEELRRQNDQPDALSRREFRKIIYGPDHPLARTETSASISSISRDDVRAFHDARYRPSTVWIGVSGDITQEAARALVEKTFGKWDRPSAEPLPPLTIDKDRDSTAGVFLTPKGTAQSQIRIGHLGIERQSPKAYAVNVLNSIYGTGGFSSRLMNRVRTEHGYVYGVGGGIFSDDPEGLFAAVAASKTESTVAAIKEIIAVTNSVINDPISPSELETARRDVSFTFINQFDTPSETISTHMLYDYRGYPADYLKKFPERIQAVTADEVKNVARELIHPDRLKIYVVGNPAQMDADLGSLGTLQPWQVDDFSGQ